jgi:hypothetical protein
LFLDTSIAEDAEKPEKQRRRLPIFEKVMRITHEAKKDGGITRTACHDKLP